MASAAAEAPEANYKIVVLKVSIHCEGCKKKVARILSKIQGIESMDIDIRQNKVTVKSLADGQTLIQKLKKHGKHAELLQEVNPSVQAHEEVKEKPQKPKKIAVVESSDSSPSTAAKKIPEAEKKVEAVEKSVSEAKEAKDETPKKTEKVEMKVDEKNSETSKPPATDKSEKAPESREVEAPKKVDDNKAKSAVEFRGDHIPQPAYIMSYNMAQPSMSQSHFVTPVAAASSQGHIYDDQYRYYSRYYDGMVEAHPDPTAYMHQPAADPYNIMFSDENPNASCSLM
ncbi:heavy metal-associated isoprenylated plant protein 35-like [Zingiber officinale]|uniref:heavy metal-associated isoprenylated plant protein 35-like n=1 Tax=Zingiber officinale TaxID=94328 RepID=UPI001C4B0630|nr:heavy metal-associated isoprenylated plant protein 35-like [Zingiber officinale]